MFNFRDYIHPKQTTFIAQVPDAYLERLDNIAKALEELRYAQADTKRTLVRIETKLSRLGIALGHGDAVSRNG